MIRFTITLILCGLSLQLTAKPSIDPRAVAVLYNSKVEESKELAEFYAQQRNIPQQNLVGLALPESGHISREQYISTLQNPLREHFTKQGWWKTTLNPEGLRVPTENRIRLIVCMHGVPYGIKRQAPAEGSAAKGIQKNNEASVDSELATFGIQGLPTGGPIKNPYYKAQKHFSQDAKLTPYVMVGRIDGKDLASAKRLITDAIATEKQGLWGMCYLDLALKGKSYDVGDQWIKKVEALNWNAGIPTTVERTKQTYLTNYPMRDVSLYYGWYTTHVNGPFLNPDFRFKRGAIAVHIHSFSAAQIRNPKRHWVGPLLEKGAAATLGNVYEPYLTLTHQFDTLQQRLLEGYPLIEAASMSIPVLSWQGVVIGDPLYQPYKRLDGSGVVADEDKVYRLTNLVFNTFSKEPDTIAAKLRSAGAKTNDGRYYEIVGLWKLHLGELDQANAFFFSAEKNYFSFHDHARLALHLAEMYRLHGKKELAIKNLNTALRDNEDEPEAKALKAMLNILSPPAPPAATPGKE